MTQANAPDYPVPDLGALMAAAPRASARGRPSVPAATLVTGTFDLDESHHATLAAQAASGVPLGVENSPLKRIRSTHHRLAQFLAAGMDESVAATLCNYDPSRVSVLKGDPAFAQLLAHYQSKSEEKFEDFLDVAAALSKDAAEEIRSRLEADPESFTVQTLIEVSKTFADRSGNGPTTKIDARVAIADVAMIERIKQNGHTQSVRTINPEDRRALASGVGGPAESVEDPE